MIRLIDRADMAATKPLQQAALSDFNWETRNRITDLQRTTRALGHPPTPTQYNATGNYHILSMYNHWQSWRDAITAAELDVTALPTPREDMDATDLFDDLAARVKAAETITDWSHILKDHLRFGNTKLNNNIAIFNMAAATDCVNRDTKHCQVPDGSCYAVRDEHLFPHTLTFRRRQEFVWDCLDADTFAKAFIELVDRKRNPVEYLRFNEAGDLRHQGDVTRLNRIGERLNQAGIGVYTYTASDFLDFQPPQHRHFTLNASNPHVEHADQAFNVVETPDDVPDNGFRCPYPTQDISCGDCLACLEQGGSGDVYEVLRGRKHSEK